MKIETLNIKENYPPADVAVAEMEIEIERLAKTDVLALKVIHGYGSHGVGGEIKRQVHKRLKELKKFGKIKNFIPAEQFGFLARQDEYLVKNLPDLIVDPDLANYNNGITIVLLNGESK
jgi:hypothetical protein